MNRAYASYAFAGAGDGAGDDAQDEADDADAGPVGVVEKGWVEVDPQDGTAITVVTVDNRLGSVRVEGHDGTQVAIFAYKRADDEDTLNRLKVSLVPDPKGPVQITTSIATGDEMRPIAAGSVTIDLVIRAPRNARVDARVWNDRLELAGMENGAELNANNGDITVSNCSGTITTHSAKGKQDFDEVYGVVDAQGLMGAMNLLAVRGDRLDANLHDGPIVGTKMRSRHVSIRTTKGDIRFEGYAFAAGTYDIKTHSGNVEVRFSTAADSPVSVWASAKGGGKVSLPAALKPKTDDAGAVTGALPAKGVPAMIELHTNTGVINFVQLSIVEEDGR